VGERLKLLTRKPLDESHWVTTIQRYGSLYHRVAGKLECLAEAARRVGQNWFQGLGSSRVVYRSGSAAVSDG